MPCIYIRTVTSDFADLGPETEVLKLFLWSENHVEYPFRPRSNNNSHRLPSSIRYANWAKFVIAPPTKCGFAASILWPEVSTVIFAKDGVKCLHCQQLAWHRAADHLKKFGYQHQFQQATLKTIQILSTSYFPSRSPKSPFKRFFTQIHFQSALITLVMVICCEWNHRNVRYKHKRLQV